MLEAPEVLEGNPYNKAIDYWGLGIVMYQVMFTIVHNLTHVKLLVGKTPFEFDGDFAKLLHR
jgi:serine/threonine protein kinase